MKKEDRLLLEAIDVENEVAEVEEEYDWEYLFSMAKLNKIFIPFYLKNRMLMPENVREKFLKQYHKYKEYAEQQKTEMIKITKLFNKEKITYLVIKGIPLSQIIYDRIDYRQSTDIDILVSEEDMDLAFEMLKQLGYGFNMGIECETNEVQLGVRPMLYYATDYFEYPCVKVMDTGMYSFVEIKKASSAITVKYIRDFIGNSVIFSIDGYCVKTLSIEYTCLHLFANFYENIKSNKAVKKGSFLREFYDIYSFMRKNADMDWEMLLYKAKKYNMSHKVLFAMNLCNELYRKKVFSDDLIKRFEKNIGEITDKEDIQFIYQWTGDVKQNVFNKEFRIRQYNKVYEDFLLHYVKKKRLDIKKNTKWKKMNFHYEGEIEFQYRIYHNFDKSFSIEIDDCNNNLYQKKCNIYIEILHFGKKNICEIIVGENYFFGNEIDCECYKEKKNDNIWKIRVLNEMEKFYLKLEIRIKVGTEGFCRIGPQAENIFYV